MMKFYSLLVLMVLYALPAMSNELTIIELQHRLPEQVIPSLEPLLDEGGTLVGANSQLFIKTTPGNLEEIKAALAALDKPMHRLLISVARQDSATQHNAGYGIHAMETSRPGKATNLRVTGNIDRSKEQENGNQLQQVQAIDGSPALIFIGQQEPYLSRVITSAGQTIQTQNYQQSGSGFMVTARVIGNDRVMLDIEPQYKESLANGNVAISTIRTEVSGRLGEWIDIGGSSGAANRQSAEIVGHQHTSQTQTSDIVLKVERLD